MTQHRNRKHAHRSAIIVTMAAALGAFIAVGCQSMVEPFEATNPPPSGCEDGCPEQCPEAELADGRPCDQVGMKCTYFDKGCLEEYDAECTADGWFADYPQCLPEGLDCPESEPAAGTPCELPLSTLPGELCEYRTDTPCGEQHTGYDCRLSELSQQYEWTPVSVPTCEVGADECQTYASSAQCEADTACAWRVPGCGDGQGAPEIEMGCYASSDCTVSGCGDWGTCTLVTVDPCWNSLCNACGAEENVCIPN